MNKSNSNSLNHGEHGEQGEQGESKHFVRSQQTARSPSSSLLNGVYLLSVFSVFSVVQSFALK
jgi:hypothetical protein